MTKFTLNGQSVTVDADADTPLLWVIRDSLGLTGTKFGCGIGLCGACTVHQDGQAIRSCITLLGDVAGARITTIEGLDPANAHPVQKAWVACVAEVTADPATGQIGVQKLTIVTDAGTIIDPDSARAQTEGAALWGLSMALFEGTAFVAGEVRDTNLNTYTPLRIGDVPVLDISFIDSIEVPVGLGEPATTVIAPAIANAIFAATGARVTHIPITPQAVLAALTPPLSP